MLEDDVEEALFLGQVNVTLVIDGAIRQLFAPCLTKRSSWVIAVLPSEELPRFPRARGAKEGWIRTSSSSMERSAWRRLVHDLPDGADEQICGGRNQYLVLVSVCHKSRRCFIRISFFRYSRHLSPPPTLGASNACQVGENPTCSVPGL